MVSVDKLADVVERDVSQMGDVIEIVGNLLVMIKDMNEALANHNDILKDILEIISKDRP